MAQPPQRAKDLATTCAAGVTQLTAGADGGGICFGAQTGALESHHRHRGRRLAPIRPCEPSKGKPAAGPALQSKEAKKRRDPSALHAEISWKDPKARMAKTAMLHNAAMLPVSFACSC